MYLAFFALKDKKKTLTMTVVSALRLYIITIIKQLC